MIFQRLLKFFPRQNGKDAGFTIIEVLVAMIILVVGILGVGKMIMVSIHGNHIAGKYTEGSNLGISEIEKIIATAYDDATLADGTNGGPLTQGIFEANWTVDDWDPLPNVKIINMVVTWNIKGQAKSFTTNYYKAVTY